MPPSCGALLVNSKTAIACGMKKRKNPASHNTRATGPALATTGTLFKLTKAAIRKNERSDNPSTRLR